MKVNKGKCITMINRTHIPSSMFRKTSTMGVHWFNLYKEIGKGNG